MFHLIMTVCVLNKPCTHESVLQSQFKDFCEIARPRIQREVIATLGHRAKFTFECLPEDLIP